MKVRSSLAIAVPSDAPRPFSLFLVLAPAAKFAIRETPCARVRARAKSKKQPVLSRDMDTKARVRVFERLVREKRVMKAARNLLPRAPMRETIERNILAYLYTSTISSTRNVRFSNRVKHLSIYNLPRVPLESRIQFGT